MKLCECGCGSPAPISTKTRKRYGHIKGKPTRFINGHYSKVQPRMEKSHAWKGGLISNNKNRYLIYMPDHHRANSGGYVMRYYLIVEKATKKPFPINAVVHHVDENSGNDNSNNLVVCENEGYHKLLHQRKRALKACGNPNYRKCWICQRYDDPKNLYIKQSFPKGGTIYHKKCKSDKQKKEYQLKKEGSCR